MENVRNRCKIEVIEKYDAVQIIKQQSKLTLNDIYMSYTNYESYIFKQNEVLMGKPIYLGLAILELSKLHMYENFFDNLQRYLEQTKLELHYMDCDSFALSTESKILLVT